MLYQHADFFNIPRKLILTKFRTFLEHLSVSKEISSQFSYSFVLQILLLITIQNLFVDKEGKKVKEEALLSIILGFNSRIDNNEHQVP